MKKLYLLLFLSIPHIIKPSVLYVAAEAMSASNKSSSPSFSKNKLTGATIGTRKSTSGAAMAIGAATTASNAASTHYIINLTGRTIILNFYRKGAFTNKTVWYDARTFGPLIWAGKATTNIIDTLNYQLLPTPIDMHTNTCFKVTVDAFKFNSSKLKDKSIKGASMPTPATSVTPNDFQITLDGDQLIVTELDTCMGIKIPHAQKKQWPSAEDIAVSRMTPQDKIITLQKQDLDLQ